MLNMADVIINRVVTDPNGDKNIFTSEDGFTTSNFSNIEIDFSKSMNYNNSGTSTMKASACAVAICLACSSPYTSTKALYVPSYT